MKKLFFLPILFLLLFGGCDAKKEEEINPKESKSNDLRGPSCPRKDVSFSDAAAELNSVWQCPQPERCNPNYTSAIGWITVYSQPAPAGLVTVATQDNILTNVYNMALQHTATSNPCPGGARNNYTYLFSAGYNSATNRDEIQVLIFFHCCPY